jgi:hypothetical protein
MGKGRDKQGREAKKKKKVKVPGGATSSDIQFRHHVVPSSQPEPQSQPARSPE